MDVTAYLPQELYDRAKAAGLSWSSLLQAAVRDELERRETMSSTLDELGTYEVAVEDRDGHGYTGRITGKRIASDGDVEVFVTEDERVLVYDGRSLRYYETDDPETDLRDALSVEQYVEAMTLLGLKPVIDL